MAARSFARDWKFWVLTVGSALTLALAIVNLNLHAGNRALRADVAARQQYINEAARLSRFSTQFIHALAQLAAQTHDESLRRALAEHGVTFTVSAPERPAASGANE